VAVRPVEGRGAQAESLLEKSAIRASEVNGRVLRLDPFRRAERVTLVGSMMPAGRLTKES
jgi:hypothetical protein